MREPAELLKCAKRELALRETNYQKWVKEGRLKQDKADYELECMSDIVALLERQVMLWETTKEMIADGLAPERMKQCVCCGAQFSAVNYENTCKICTGGGDAA